MILYDLLHGDPRSVPSECRPCTCFLMTKLGPNVPDVVTLARQQLQLSLAEHGFELMDADSRTTGKDFLGKIWCQMIAVPLGIAIIYRKMPRRTLGNVFFELGVMAALGKETLIIRIDNASMPSDFVRTEWVPYDDNFAARMDKFMANLRERAEYHVLIAEQLERDPLLAIDYYRRAYLLSRKESLKAKARVIFEESGLAEIRAKNSVEALLAGFCLAAPGS